MGTKNDMSWGNQGACLLGTSRTIPRADARFVDDAVNPAIRVPLKDQTSSICGVIIVDPQ